MKKQKRKLVILKMLWADVRCNVHIIKPKDRLPEKYPLHKTNDGLCSIICALYGDDLLTYKEKEWLEDYLEKHYRKQKEMPHDEPMPTYWWKGKCKKPRLRFIESLYKQKSEKIR